MSVKPTPFKERFYIDKAGTPGFEENSKVRIHGWVYNKRSSGKIKFLVVRDGTGMVQGVLVKGECDEQSFEDFEKLTQESAIIVEGILRKHPRTGDFELGVTKLETVSIAEPYPISPKEHGVEFLMENRHLWIRSTRQHAGLRVRWEIIKSIREYFDKNGFVLFDAPILTPSSCEGTSNLFETPYFDGKAYLTQSGQLYGEVGAMAFGKIYVFGPTFRAEKSKTRKHLTEFWMVEPEVAYNDLYDTMDLGTDLLHYVITNVLKNRTAELKVLERDTKDLIAAIEKPFPRITYDEALKILEKRGVGVPWGEDFGAPQETAIGEEFGVPVFIHHFPAQIKAFYFKHDPENSKYALGCDLIAPHGYGEIIGGGQREESVAVLEKRVEEHQLNMADYQWYLDLRRFGGVPHAGFGLGVERTVSWICGMDHVRETIPFPRMIHTIKP